MNCVPREASLKWLVLFVLTALTGLGLSGGAALAANCTPVTNTVETKSDNTAVLLVANETRGASFQVVFMADGVEVQRTRILPGKSARYEKTMGSRSGATELSYILASSTGDPLQSAVRSCAFQVSYDKKSGQIGWDYAEGASDLCQEGALPCPICAYTCSRGFSTKTNRFLTWFRVRDND